MSVRDSRFGRLAGHFFTGFLDNDLLISSQVGMQNLLSQLAGLLAVPGLFYCLLLPIKYGPMRHSVREMMTWDDRLLFIHCSMVVTGLFTIIEWDALFPDRRDYYILSPLPLSPRTIFLAKACSVMGLLVLMWAALNLGTSILFPCIALASGDSGFALLRNIAAHVTATFTASAFVFLLLIGFQGLLLNALSPRWFRRVSLYVQLGALFVLILLLFMTPLVAAQAGRWITGNHGATRLGPSYWFLGLYQVLIGRGGPVFDRLAALALQGLGTAAAVSVLTYFASYRRHLAKSLESSQAELSEPGPLAAAVDGALNLFVLRHPLERAHFYFIRATLLRSRLHRLALGAWLGVACALILGLVAAFARDAVRGAPTPGLLSAQLVLSFLVLCGMRFVFTLPAELRANWTFQAAESTAKGRCAVGARKAMLALGAVPVLAVLAPLHIFVWGWGVAAVHLLFGGAVAALLVELLLLGFGKIPFTCSYLPGKSNIKALWSVYLFGFWALAHWTAKLEAAMFARPMLFVLFFALAAATVAALRWYGSRRFGPGYRFTFDDQPDPAVRTLDISHGSAWTSPAAETPSAESPTDVPPVRTEAPAELAIGLL